MTGGGDSGNPPGSKGPLPKLDAPFPAAPKPGGPPQPTPTGEILPIDHPLSASSKRLVPTPSDPSALAGLAPPSIAPLAPPPAAPRRRPTAPGMPAAKHGAPGTPPARPPAAGSAPAARPPSGAPTARATTPPPGPGAPTARSTPPAPLPGQGAPRPPPGATRAPVTPGSGAPVPVARPAATMPPAARPPQPPPLPAMTETSLGIPVMPLETEAAPLPSLGISIAPLTTPAAPATPEPAPDDPVDRVAWKAERLDAFDYFELLGIPTDASAATVKRAFYRESRAYHPDRFFHLADEAFKTRVHDVYKRVTEAYFVLRDDTRRRKYLADVTGPDRAHKLRFDEVAEKETQAAAKQQAQEQIGTHPKGRQLFQTGVAELERGQLSAAERTLKMALTYEPQNPLYKEKLAQVQDLLHEEDRRTGKAFKIT